MWTKETADGYGQMRDEELAHVKRIKMQFAALTVGAKILFFNHAHRRNEWKTIQGIQATTAHTGFITATDGRKIWASEILLVQAAKTEQIETLRICLSERIAEFKSVISRAADSDLTVYADFEPDTFVVVNTDKNSEYRVEMETVEGKIFSSCECADFKHRNRVCKHQSEVLKFAFSGLYEKLQTEQVKRFHASFEAGNFKRRHGKQSAYFDNLSDAKSFVERGIGSLQGFGKVSDGNRTVWEYEDEAEYHGWQ